MKTDALLGKFREKFLIWRSEQRLSLDITGETEEIFQELKDWVREQKFDRLGCFYLFSRRNTTAHVLEDNIPQEVKEARVEEIMELQSQISWEKNQEK